MTEKFTMSELSNIARRANAFEDKVKRACDSLLNSMESFRVAIKCFCEEPIKGEYHIVLRSWTCEKCGKWITEESIERAR